MKPYTLAVKAVIINESGATLLLRRSASNARFVGCWEWPGGKVDPGEDFADAAIRETLEESGLDVELIGLAGATAFEMSNVHVVLLCMEAAVRRGDVTLSHEHDAWEWVPLAQIGTRKLIDSTRGFILNYAEHKQRELQEVEGRGLPR